ncbi:hypothetical protein HYDPIDRAFT_119679 [Hydnomerulius pinastri MD-312]|uniref:Uncharacterized protein n=1 Tax=Hydnomerulius pinastri MD-312 TaxID=994086 RepID=A0A0C9W7D2_9AGAM|nr:hypothetical protein HYDPIDRAFT_119679 [Hydnomerulius pinastri MD-312]
MGVLGDEGGRLLEDAELVNCITKRYTAVFDERGGVYLSSLQDMLSPASQDMPSAVSLEALSPSSLEHMLLDDPLPASVSLASPVEPRHHQYMFSREPENVQILSEPTVFSTSTAAYTTTLPPSSERRCFPCLWMISPGTECLTLLDESGVARHFHTFHGIDRRSSSAMMCGWKGCNKTLREMNIIWHVRTTHLGITRSQKRSPQHHQPDEQNLLPTFDLGPSQRSQPDEQNQLPIFNLGSSQRSFAF